MQRLILHRTSRLKGLRTMLGYALISRTRQSLLLFKVIGSELDGLIAESDELEHEREALAAVKGAYRAIQTPGITIPPFDDGDHLVEDQMPQAPRDESDTPQETGPR